MVVEETAQIEPEQDMDQTKFTLGQFYEWTRWAKDAHQIPSQTADHRLNATKAIFGELEENWEEVSLVGLDLDKVQMRYRNAKRGQVSEEWLKERMGRIRNGIKAYEDSLRGIDPLTTKRQRRERSNGHSTHRAPPAPESAPAAVRFSDPDGWKTILVFGKLRVQLIDDIELTASQIADLAASIASIVG